MNEYEYDSYDSYSYSVRSTSRVVFNNSGYTPMLSVELGKINKV